MSNPLSREPTVLLTPGPVSVDASVLDALARPVRPHYGASWAQRYASVCRSLAEVFGTRADVMLVFGPGTAALEMAMASALAPDDEIVIPNTGRFARRLIAVAEAIGLDVHTIDVALHQALSRAELEDALERYPGTRAVALVHHETGLGLMNQIEELCRVARDAGALTIVDAVSSLGGVEVAMDSWGIDICAGVANKCLGAPIGVAPLAVSERAWKAVDDGRAKSAGWYLNLATWREASTTRPLHPHPTTMATSVIEGLSTALDRLLEEGVSATFKRHREASARVRSGLRALGFEFVVADSAASPLTTAVYAPAEMNVTDYMSWLEQEHGLLIAGAFDELATKAFRVGHMGVASEMPVVERYLAATQAYLQR